MERLRFEREIFTVLSLSREEVQSLTCACESHYDGDVQALSKPGRGAVLNAARVELEDKDLNSIDIRLNYRQLDTLCKATEIVNSPWVHRDGHPLHQKLRELLHEAGQEWTRSNPEWASAFPNFA